MVKEKERVGREKAEEREGKGEGKMGGRRKQRKGREGRE